MCERQFPYRARLGSTMASDQQQMSQPPSWLVNTPNSAAPGGGAAPPPPPAQGGLGSNASMAMKVQGAAARVGIKPTQHGAAVRTIFRVLHLLSCGLVRAPGCPRPCPRGRPHLLLATHAAITKPAALVRET